jgi:ABC-type antimicrobial peptide transport system permease subunit
MNKKTTSPPRIAARILGFIIQKDIRYGAMGDLEEQFYRMRKEHGTFKARLLYWKQICGALPYFIRNSILWSLIMFKNYLKTTFRNTTRHKGYSFINLAGLAIGMACTLLILLWVQHELSYDRFHEKADNIFMVLRGEEETVMVPTSYHLAPALVAELPEIINATRFSQLPETEKVFFRSGEKVFEENISFADSHFFEIFSFPFLKGTPESALEGPSSVVITEKTARKYFGDGEAFGNSIQMLLFGAKIPVSITGVIKDIPSNSHIDCDIFVTFHTWSNFGIDLENLGWENQMASSYILTRDNSDVEDLASKITACEIRNRPDDDLEKLFYSLLPLKNIHLQAKNIKFFATTGNSKYVYIFTVIAFIILLIACVNYTNLSVALSLKRAKEIGVRKVVGANRSTLIKQLLGETIVLSFLALLLAVLLARLLIPTFNRLSGKSLTIQFFDIRFLIGAVLIAFLTGILSGYYPALFLSSFQPAKILKAKSGFALKGMALRKGLVVFQFSLSIILIISTIVVFNQLLFIKNSDIGYDRDHILCARIAGDMSGTYDVLKNELLKNPDILGVCRTEPLDANIITNTDSVKWRGKEEDKTQYFRVLRADYDLVSTYGIKMEAGRFYSREFPADAEGSYVINKAAAKAMGLESPVGEEISLWDRKGSIIGVVSDFHFGSFHQSIEPLLMILPSEKFHNIYLRLLSVRFRSGTLKSSTKYVADKWKAIIPDMPYDYYFLNDALNTQYRAEQRMGMLFRYFTILAIFIACLGLYGLTSISAEQKIKEIGIRKVLGASASNITVMLSKEFMKWVVLANFIAWPVAWYAMNKWLQNFAYRIHTGWGTFCLAGALALGIALFTVSFQAFRAATANPVDSLRYE